jgi:hypothetical protein
MGGKVVPLCDAQSGWSVVLFRFYRKPTDRDVAERMPSRLPGGSLDAFFISDLGWDMARAGMRWKPCSCAQRVHNRLKSPRTCADELRGGRRSIHSPATVISTATVCDSRLSLKNPIHVQDRNWLRKEKRKIRSLCAGCLKKNMYCNEVVADKPTLTGGIE